MGLVLPADPALTHDLAALVLIGTAARVDELREGMDWSTEKCSHPPLEGPELAAEANRKRGPLDGTDELWERVQPLVDVLEQPVHLEVPQANERTYIGLGSLELLRR